MTRKVTQVCHRVVFAAMPDVISRATTSWSGQQKPAPYPDDGALSSHMHAYAAREMRIGTHTWHAGASVIAGRMRGGEQARRRADVRQWRRHHVPEEKRVDGVPETRRPLTAPSPGLRRDGGDAAAPRTLSA